MIDPALLEKLTWSKNRKPERPRMGSREKSQMAANDGERPTSATAPLETDPPSCRTGRTNKQQVAMHPEMGWGRDRKDRGSNGRVFLDQHPGMTAPAAPRVRREVEVDEANPPRWSTILCHTRGRA